MKDEQIQIHLDRQDTVRVTISDYKSYTKNKHKYLHPIYSYLYFIYISYSKTTYIIPYHTHSTYTYKNNVDIFCD